MKAFKILWRKRIIPPIFIYFAFHIRSHENFEGWTVSHKALNIQNFYKQNKNLTSPIVVDWKNQNIVPFHFNRITKRSQSLPKTLMDPEKSLIPVYKNLAYLANDAYCDAISDPINVDYGFLETKTGGAALVVYFAGPKRKKIFWRTEIDRQILFQVKGFPTFDDDARVNKPFLEIIESVFPSILEKMRELLKIKPETRQIFFVGHAIGGAYASIAGLRWAIQRYEITQLNLWPEINMDEMGQHIITFGAPRIGNSRFSRFANGVIDHHRITHGNDHVPQSPLDPLKWNHFGFEIWIEPLENCDCPDDANFHRYSYWDCNNQILQGTQRQIWIENWASENMECNKGQSIINVPDDLFHDGPYFDIRMGVCTDIFTKNLETNGLYSQKNNEARSIYRTSLEWDNNKLINITYLEKRIMEAYAILAVMQSKYMAIHRSASNWQFKLCKISQLIFSPHSSSDKRQ
ncbi:hypothetical protein G9A89_023412 [Geosiphon pyriformis]|nr:hypothetical protein G9A89_023412 [Geosiphon pyriformis]